MQRLLQLKHPHHAAQITLSRAQVNVWTVRRFTYSQQQLDLIEENNVLALCRIPDVLNMSVLA